jgi:hypothetical protein
MHAVDEDHCVGQREQGGMDGTITTTEGLGTG